jgi:ATP-dependent protease ClpP protease subunit
VNPKQAVARARQHVLARDGSTQPAPKAPGYRIVDQAGPGQPAQVWIYEEIGFWGITAECFVEDLQRITAPEIHVHINSPGGEVFDGLAIYNALRSHPATVTCIVEGLAASAASFIAMAGSTVLIARAGFMMIHDAMTFAFGNPAELRELADFLDKVSDSIADIYAQKAGGDIAQWRPLMQEETWYTGQEAVDAGLADALLSFEDTPMIPEPPAPEPDPMPMPMPGEGPDDVSGDRPAHRWDLAAVAALTSTGRVPDGVTAIAEAAATGEEPAAPEVVEPAAGQEPAGDDTGAAPDEEQTAPADPAPPPAPDGPPIQPEPEPAPQPGPVPAQPEPPQTPAEPDRTTATPDPETAPVPDAEWAHLVADLTEPSSPTVDDLLANLRE